MRRPIAWLAGGTLAVAAVALVLTGAYRPVEAPESFGIAAAVVSAMLSAVMVGLSVARPWWGLLLFTAAMPLVNVARAQAWIGPIQVIPSTLVIAAIAVGTLLQPGQASAPGTPPPPARRTWLVLAIAASLAVAATLVARSTGGAANITLHGVLEPMAMFALVVALRPAPSQALHALLAVAAGVTLGTLINLAWLALVLVPHDLYEQRLLLARLTYFNAGIFGAMLVVGIPAAASLLFLRPRMPGKGLAAGGAALAIGLMVAALFFTYTKSAWLSAALVASLLIVLLVAGWRRRVPMLLAVAVLLALVVPYPLPVLRAVAPDLASGYQSFLVAMQGSARVESWDPETYQGSGSISIRLEAVGAAAELTAEAPWLGVGPGGFQREFARIRPDATVPELQSAHNLLPNLAAEYGLPFALLVAIGLLLSIGGALRAGRSATQLERVVGSVIGVCLIGFVCMATLFGADLYRPYRTMNLDVLTAALLAGLSYSVTRAVQDRRLAQASSTGAEGGKALEQAAQLRPAGRDELERPGA